MTGSDPANSYGRWRRIFGILFVVSTIILLGLAIAFAFQGREQSGAQPTQLPPPTEPPSETQLPETATAVATATPAPPPSGGNLEFPASAVAIAASCLTSLTSLIGFVFTTVVGIRRERRESQSAEVERKIRELELERQKLELERKRLQGNEEETSRKGD